VVATSAAPGERELQDWVRRTLAGYKVPRRIVLVDRLPRTPTGKLEVARAKRLVEGGTA
jgi:3-oxocholest-4-en-26-oate---CoA ligase